MAEREREGGREGGRGKGRKKGREGGRGNKYMQQIKLGMVQYAWVVRN